MAVNNVTQPHPDYTANLILWERMRDTIAGQDAVKNKGVLYLPPLNDSDVEECGKQTSAYKIYIDNAEFYNATSLTFEAFIGMIFRKPIRVEKDESSDLEKLLADPLLRNVDFEGTSIETFSYEVTQEVAAVGRVGILYDAPTVEEMTELSVNEAAAEGIRPYLKMYTAENIINWKFKNINGVRKLVLVVLKELVETKESEMFDHDTEDQYRALIIDENDKYVQRVYDDSGAELVEEANTDITINGAALQEIPFVCINAKSIDLDVEKPPLLDLANTNLSHYKKSASLGSCIHMFGRITPMFKVPFQHLDAFRAQPMEFGVTKNIIIPTAADGADADGGFLEPNADFTGVVNEMQRLEGRMAAQGARALRPQKSGVESAETVGLDMMSELSILGAIAINVSIGLTISVSRLMGGDSENMTKIKLNDDFLTAPIDASMVAAMLKAVASGDMSQEQFIDAMVRGEAILPESEISTDTDFTEKEVEETPREAAEVNLLTQQLNDGGEENTNTEQEIEE